MRKRDCAVYRLLFMLKFLVFKDVINDLVCHAEMHPEFGAPVN